MARQVAALEEPSGYPQPKPERQGQQPRLDRSAFVPEIGDEAVCSREVGAPETVVADVCGTSLADRLRDRTERRVGDHGRTLPVHADQLLTRHRQRPGDLSV